MGVLVLNPTTLLMYPSGWEGEPVMDSQAEGVEGRGDATIQTDRRTEVHSLNSASWLTVYLVNVCVLHGSAASARAAISARHTHTNMELT